jgi:hypothetical protein
VTENSRLTAPELNLRRIAASLEFHRDRLRWLSELNPVWGDGVPVTKSDIKLYGDQSREAIRMLEEGHFVAGGDA